VKVCIYGAGAIGGYIGVLMKLAGADVSLIARGAHLTAIRKDGLKLLIGGGEKSARMTATSDPSELGPQDYVIVALKAHQAWEVAEQMKPLLGPHTAVVTAQNGLPWWYFYGFEGQYANRRIESVDPGDR
jgi:2-dehydropantoate 2-reductase